jgi:thiol-disulfide isomerase/thioredoxin
MRFALMSFAAILLAVTPATAATAPRLDIVSLAALTVPDAPFDSYANADADVDAAFARARHSGKYVLIDLGGNWCGDCRVLAGVMALPQLRAFLNAHYEIVDVDVGRFNRNLQIPARFGITERLEGVPCVLIARPDGTLVNEGHTEALMDARRMEPQDLADWFAQWVK